MTAMDPKRLADAELQKIIQISQHSKLENFRFEILNSFDQFETAFNQLKEKVKKQIEEEEKPYFQNSYKTYEEFRSHRYSWYKWRDPSEYVNNVLSSRLPVLDQTQEFILNRITRCSGWQTTTMILRPGSESWIHNMVSNDPIYLVDEDYELLKPVLSQFNDLYQRRLRTYTIQEDQDQDILWQLPDNQFGLVLAWNYFNHRPFEIIRQYLTELYEKIRPGGMLLMTYNDCDRWEGVKSVEATTGLYTPGSLIKSFAESLGFEQHFTYHDNGPWTWIELRKPGEWQSYRGGQALAQILPKPVAESK
jgi:SAM-dependent methyltransferase